MTIIKLHLKLRKPFKKEICRWDPKKELKDLTMEDIYQKMNLITDFTSQFYHIRWYDGFDMCLITNTDDLREATKVLLTTNKSPDNCVHLFVEGVRLPRGMSADGRLQNNSKSTNGQILIEEANQQISGSHEETEDEQYDALADVLPDITTAEGAKVEEQETKKENEHKRKRKEGRAKKKEEKSNRTKCSMKSTTKGAAEPSNYCA
jgi:hypothetical protein